MTPDFKFQAQWINALLAEDIVEGIVSDSRLPSEERFEIYSDAFWIRRSEVIEFLAGGCYSEKGPPFLEHC